MGTYAGGDSISEFEKEAEHTRADLIHTVDELHHRVSGAAIKEEMKAYARDTGQDLIRRIEERARENPLQAVAVAAGLAYPVWRLLMNIPAPVILVGAGLALAGKGGPGHSTLSPARSSGEPLGSMAKRSMQDASAAVSDTVADMKDKAAGMVGDAANAVRSGLSSAGDRAASAAGEAMSSARSVASDTLSATGEALSATYQAGVDAVGQTGQQMSETFRRSTNTLVEAIENHPFVCGAVGLFVGAAIAAALPVTQAENQMFGDTSDDIKNRASDLAGRGMQAASDAAQDLYQEAAARVKDEGLSPETVRETIKGVGEKVSDVLEQAGHAVQTQPAASTPHSTSGINPKIGD